MHQNAYFEMAHEQLDHVSYIILKLLKVRKIGQHHTEMPQLKDSKSYPQCSI